MKKLRKTDLGLVLLLGGMACATAQGQEAQPSNPATALSEGLGAACRQDEAHFARYLTADNAAAFHELAVAQRTALMKRLILLEEPGRPLLSSDAAGRTVLRCEASSVSAEMRFGDARVRENLAFIPVEARGETRGAGEAGRRVDFGMVREGGGWKFLSVGLLLLDLPALARQWAQQAENSEIEAQEAAAIAALRKIAEAILTYRRAFGRMPEALAQLGPPPKGGVSPDAAGLLDAELAAGSKGGYVFRSVILSPSEEATEPRFNLAATPAQYSKTGRRSFFLDASGVLRGGDKQGTVATAQDPRIEPR
jgi:hypothetical protein